MKAPIAALNAAFAADSEHGFLKAQQSSQLNATAVSWLQSSQICGNQLLDPCKFEGVQALLLVIILSVVIVLMLVAFAFFREDKEEQITPLSPHLVVRDGDLKFKLPLDEKSDHMTVTNWKDEPLCKVVMDWPDPFRPGATGVAAAVRLMSPQDQTLATVVARTMAVVGQGLAVCRSGCEIFGFIEVDGNDQYHIRHRTGVHLLTLLGDFDNINIVGLNPMGVKVCSLKREDGECKGSILQHVDAGLMICALLATNVHRRLNAKASQLPPRVKDSAEGEEPSTVPEDREQESASTKAPVAETGSEPSAVAVGKPDAADEEHDTSAAGVPTEQEERP